MVVPKVMLKIISLKTTTGSTMALLKIAIKQFYHHWLCIVANSAKKLACHIHENVAPILMHQIYFYEN